MESSDVAPVATSSPPSNISVRLKVAAVDESESMSTELAEPVSAHPAGRPTSLGGPGVEGPAGSPLVGVSALRYPSGQADPLDIGGQVSTGIVVAEIHVERDQPPGTDDDTTTTSRQPSAIAAAARLPPEGPSHF